MKTKYSTTKKMPLVILAVVLIFLGAPEAEASKLVLEKPMSRIQFHGKSNGHGFEGKSSLLEGELDADWETQTLLKPSEISIPIAGFVTGNDARDHAMQHMFEMEKFPGITFIVENITPLSLSDDLGAKTFRLDGQLKIHNVSKPVTLEVHAEFKDDTVRVGGETVIDVVAYGMKPPAMLGIFRVQKDVNVRFDTYWKRIHE